MNNFKAPSTPAYNKVIYGDKVLIDLTQDTVTPESLLSGAKAHDKRGYSINGTCTFDVDSTDATVAVAEMLVGKTAYARGAKLTGTMPNIGAATGTISALDDEYTIAMGFHDGSGKVGIAAAEKEKVVPGNIKAGVVVLGVTGTYSGEAISAQSRNVTPTVAGFTVQPEEGYDYLSSVVIAPIPYAETENSAGGITVTIG